MLFWLNITVKMNGFGTGTMPTSPVFEWVLGNPLRAVWTVPGDKLFKHLASATYSSVFVSSVLSSSCWVFANVFCGTGPRSWMILSQVLHSAHFNLLWFSHVSHPATGIWCCDWWENLGWCWLPIRICRPGYTSVGHIVAEHPWNSQLMQPAVLRHGEERCDCEHIGILRPDSHGCSWAWFYPERRWWIVRRRKIYYIDRW